MLTNDLWLLCVAMRAVWARIEDEPKCRVFMVIWAFEFIEELEARGVKRLPNVKGRRVESWCARRNDGRKTCLALTFVLLSTHFNHNTAAKIFRLLTIQGYKQETNIIFALLINWYFFLWQFGKINNRAFKHLVYCELLFKYK